MERISTGLFYRRGTNTMLEQQAKLSKTELQLATGKRVLSPKDDPASAAYLLNLRSTIGQVEQYQVNSDRARARLALEDITLQGVTDMMPRVIELAIQGQNDINSASDRAAIALELRQLNEELMGLANTRDSDGEYIFAGFDSNSPPFSTPSEGTYSYTGDMGSRSLQISATRQVQDRDNGFDVFMDVAVWSATRVTGVAATSFGAISAGDISIDGGNGTGPVSLGALPVAADAAERATQLMSAINAVSDQTGVTAANSTITTLTLTSDNDKDMDLGFSGTATTANTGLTAGTYSAVTAKRNIFETIHQVIAGLEADAPDSAYLDDVHLAQQHLLDFRATAGARLNTIEKQNNINEDFLLTMKTAQSEVEDLDYAEAIGRFEQQLLALQAAQQTFSKVQSLSLFNFL